MEENREVTTEVAETPEVTEEVQVETPAEEIKETVSETETEEAKPPAKKKETYQEGIDRITRARREAEREREYWKKVALEKGREEPREEKPASPETSHLPPRPTLDQFDTTMAYEDALFDWRDHVRETQTRVAKQQADYDDALQTFNQRAKVLREEHEDFDEVIEAPVFSPAMRLALLRSENGPQVAYHLGRPENRDLADKIRKMPIEMQPYEIGKLETRLIMAKQTKRVTGAPPPITPVGMGGGGIVDESKLTDDEWYVLEKQRTLDKLKKKYGG